jgi:UDP-glucuronate 4-epimerase
MKILVTGTAGFVGHYVGKYLSARGDTVVGIDCINDYYDVNLKYGRLADAGFDAEKIRSASPDDVFTSSEYSQYTFIKMDMTDLARLDSLFKYGQFDRVINLAAQPGVRYSLENPHAYINANIQGFMNILECCRHHKVEHLVYASSSSVYGLNESQPFKTTDNVDHPISLYAATKKSNELMAHTYSHLYNLPTTGLRFFTVYGPWGRPDMAVFMFTKAIFEGKPIDVYNNGNMSRDFTYIDDIVEGIVRTMDNPPKGNEKWSGMDPDPGSSIAPYKIYNIGRNAPVNLMDFIASIEKNSGRKAEKRMMPLQPGDVQSTYADVDDLIADTGYRPKVSIDEGMAKFVEWYVDFYNIAK